ncbi:MAG: hypothetical protein KGJ98_03695 [Chloroflexota bacterium]|nr:hypothetical protein [Chloroflexota bacterium]
MIPVVLADGTPADAFQEYVLLAAAAAGYLAFRRLRGSGFRSWPLVTGWIALVASAGLAVAALVVPAILWPPPAAVRPASTARIAIDAPTQGEVFTGDPATVAVRLSLEGGTIVPFTTTKLTPTTGHIHLYLDDELVDMTTALGAEIRVPPGDHTLRAEFVAADHAPFDPPVVARRAFVVKSP